MFFSFRHVEDTSLHRFCRKMIAGKLSLSSFALLVGLSLYAFRSSPTPNNPSIAEAIIFILLAMSIGMSGVTKIFSSINMRTYKGYILFFVFGLTIPVVVGLMQGGNLSIMIRDVVAFLFLCLPLLFLFNIRDKLEFGLSLFIGCAIIAIIFSARVVFNGLPLVDSTSELLYLANSPLVLFFAIYFIGLSYQSLFSYKYLKKILLFVVFFSISIFILYAMAQDVQRATLLAVFISFLFIIIDHFIKSPVQSIGPLILMTALIFYSWSMIEDVFMAIEMKTSLVGFNARYREFTAVWQEIGSNPLKTFFGLGWGSRFESPALGGLHASFTHSFLTYMLLKTGVIGLFITLLYCGGFLYKISDIFLKNRIVGIAFFWSFVIPVFLYASYKSFDFGLLLTLITAFAFYYRDNEKIFNPNY